MEFRRIDAERTLLPMKRWLLRTLTTLTCLLLIACPAANAANDVRGAGADPVLSDGDKYHLVFESDCVRVLDYRDAPGARRGEPAHHDSG